MSNNLVTSPVSSNLKELITDALDFLKKFGWIHDVLVTKIFDGTLQNIPAEWLPYLTSLDTEGLNKLPFLGDSSTRVLPACPESLQEVLRVASRLSLERGQATIQPTGVDPGMARGMNPKKLHEVSYMASLVHDLASEAGCDLIVDVGSGLGYLDHILHQVYGHKVLGLETEHSHVTRAEARAAQQGLQCDGVRCAKFNLTRNPTCFQQFEALISDVVSGVTPLEETTVSDSGELAGDGRETSKGRPPFARVCLIGLHCCGDLTPAMLGLFQNSASVQAMCCVSCCYHKMSFASDGCVSFPVSSHCRRHYDCVEGGGPRLVSPQTLRLGAQETRGRWRHQSEEDHNDHMRHVAFRGLVEITECGDAELKRKLVRKCDFSSFEAFLESYFTPSSFSHGPADFDPASD